MEVAGLAVGITALFSTVLDGFEFVIKAKKFSIDFETLNSLLSTHKLRFYIFGRAYGLVKGQDGRADQPDTRLRTQNIQTVVEGNAESIKNCCEKLKVL